MAESKDMKNEAFTVPDEFTEAYEVVRTLMLYSNARQHYRIEIVRALRGGGANEFRAKYAESVRGSWTELTGVASVDEHDLDYATHQALGWLRSYARGTAKEESTDG